MNLFTMFFSSYPFLKEFFHLIYPPFLCNSLTYDMPSRDLFNLYSSNFLADYQKYFDNLVEL